jgi:hypothetical protein
VPEINNTEVVGFNTNFQMEGEAEHKEKKLRIERKRNNRELDKQDKIMEILSNYSI